MNEGTKAALDFFNFEPKDEATRQRLENLRRESARSKRIVEYMMNSLIVDPIKIQRPLTPPPRD